MHLSELMNDNDRDAAYRQACVSGFSRRLVPVAHLYLIALLGDVRIKATLITSIFINMSQSLWILIGPGHSYPKVVPVFWQI